MLWWILLAIFCLIVLVIVTDCVVFIVRCKRDARRMRGMAGWD